MGKRILIVDDDSDLLDLLTCAFLAAGYATMTAANGKDALKKARSLLPDAIVLDLVLPGIDGFTVCETLRKERATADIPVLMLTGLVGQLNRFAGLECGANDYVTKPVTPDHIVARTARLLREAPEYLPVPAYSRPDVSAMPVNVA